ISSLRIITLANHERANPHRHRLPPPRLQSPRGSLRSTPRPLPQLSLTPSNELRRLLVKNLEPSTTLKLSTVHPPRHQRKIRHLTLKTLIRQRLKRQTTRLRTSRTRNRSRTRTITSTTMSSHNYLRRIARQQPPTLRQGKDQNANKPKSPDRRPTPRAALHSACASLKLSG